MCKLHISFAQDKQCQTNCRGWESYSIWFHTSMAVICRSNSQIVSATRVHGEREIQYMHRGTHRHTQVHTHAHTHTRAIKWQNWGVTDLALMHRPGCTESLDLCECGPGLPQSSCAQQTHSSPGPSKGAPFAQALPTHTHTHASSGTWLRASNKRCPTLQRASWWLMSCTQRLQPNPFRVQWEIRWDWRKSTSWL